MFWNQFAMIAEQHLKKGDLVRVTGKVTVDTYLENDYVKVSFKLWLWVWVA